MVSFNPREFLSEINRPIKGVNFSVLKAEDQRIKNNTIEVIIWREKKENSSFIIPI